MFSFNRFSNNGLAYKKMKLYYPVDYSRGWNPELHDYLLERNIEKTYIGYDPNF